MTGEEEQVCAQLYAIGYRNGVCDHDHKKERMNMPIRKVGIHYLEGYETGYKDAEVRRWYIVSLDNKDIKHWYVDRKDLNSWVDTQEEATEFSSEESVKARYTEMTSNLGRGDYNYVWKKVKHPKRCKFICPWVGRCNKHVEGEMCDEHKDLKCVICTGQATTMCGTSMLGLICGQPLCNSHHHCGY